jgi:hypothetical protein
VFLADAVRTTISKQGKIHAVKSGGTTLQQGANRWGLIQWIHWIFRGLKSCLKWRYPIIGDLASAVISVLF